MKPISLEVASMRKFVKKTIEFIQDSIDRACKIFGVRTDKAAANRALELLIIDDAIIKAHDRIGGKGDMIEQVFK